MIVSTIKEPLNINGHVINQKNLFITPVLDDKVDAICKKDILGIVLESGKIVSLNPLKITKFSIGNFEEYPADRYKVKEIEAKKDLSGSDNTDFLGLYCYDSGLEVFNNLKD